jgi:RNA polymerase sigma-70 factor (ECF subfamily)
MNSQESDKKELQIPQILNLDDDFSLIKRYIDGDEPAFKVLVLRHKERVRNIIYLTIGNVTGVDDIAQEVFITVFKNLKQFRFESQFSTWLYRITINKCKDHLRKVAVRNIFTGFKDSGSDESEPNYEMKTEHKDISEFVQDAIKKLPSKLRIPLVLKDIEGFSYQEIAETVQCDLGTVKSRIFRARQGLKNILAPLEKELRL